MQKSKIGEIAHELEAVPPEAHPGEDAIRRQQAVWCEENKDAIAHYNARIARDGLPLAKYRNFARSLGDGRKT